AGGVAAVDHAVVVGEEQVHHLTDGDGVVALGVLHDHRTFGDGAGAEDAHLRCGHDRGVPQGAAGTGVGDGEGGTGEIVRGELVALRTPAEVPDLARQARQVQVAGVLDHRDHETALGVRGHTDVLRAVV